MNAHTVTIATTTVVMSVTIVINAIATAMWLSTIGKLIGITKMEEKMTNRQWLIWYMIDMDDEEFAHKLNGRGWFCEICASKSISDCNGRDCQREFIEWLRQEHKEEN